MRSIFIFIPLFLFPACVFAASPLASYSSDGLSFGTHAVGEISVVQTITLTNSGTDTLNIGSIVLEGVDAADFNLTGDCGTTLGLGTSCTLSVTLTPSAAGLRTAGITVSSDAPDSPHTLTLAGIGRQGSIAAGRYQSLALRVDGSVWGWGNNQNGELGVGGGLSKTQPVQIMAAGSGVVEVVTSWNHSLALKSDGSVWAWGANWYGQVGDGTTSTRYSPVQVLAAPGVPLTGVVAIGAGANHALALKSDGSVWSWGYNNYGQLGDGTSSQRNYAVPVQGLGAGSGVVALDGGEEHSLALKSDGSVWSWGANWHGELGDGSGSGKVIPVQVLVSPGVPLTGVAQITAGRYTSQALKADGSGWGWGINMNGQLGLPMSIYNLNPVQVFAPGSGVIGLVMGSSHTLQLYADGSVWATGHNYYGQLGIGTSGSGTDAFAPVEVLAAGSGAVALSGNEQHSLVFHADGSVTSWGSNGSGQLGDGSTTLRTSPVVIALNWAWASFSPTSLSFTRLLGTGPSAAQSVIVTNASSSTVSLSSIAATGDFAQSNNCGATLAAGASCTLDVTFIPTLPGSRSGTVTITSGDGVRSLALSGEALAPAVTLAPASVDFGLRDIGTTSGVRAVMLTNSGTATLSLASITLGGSHAADFNLIHGCGATLAAGASCSFSVTMTPLAEGARTASITVVSNALGSPDTLALSGTGNLVPIAFSTTNVIYGKRAVGSTSDVRTIKLTSGTGTLNIASIALGGTNAGDFNLTYDCGATLSIGASCNLSVTLTPSAAGLRSASLTVTSDAPGSPHTVTLAGIGQQGNVAAGRYHSLALRVDGSVWGWGNNSFGELGVGGGLSKTQPVQIMAAGSGVVEVVTSWNHSLALKSDGSVWAWGANWYGQIGDGTTNNRYSPVQVLAAPGVPLADVVAIGVGANHALALKSDGSVWSWGYNNYGQLGDGTSSQRNYPVPVQGLGAGSGVVALDGGEEHSLALKSDGSVWSWGANWYGELGDGSGSTKVTPVQVLVAPGVPLTGVAQITAGRYTSQALKADGSVWGWGTNSNGQFGLAMSTFNYYPIQVLAPEGGVIGLVMGSSHALLLKNNGSVWATGHNYYGQLGIGTSGLNTDAFAPVEVLAAGSGAVALSGNEQHSLVFHADGSVTSWGSNGSGQLGDGSTTLRTTPVAAKFNQTIGVLSFSPSVLFVGGTTTALATATSGLPVSFSSATLDVCTVSGDTISGVTAGICTIAADQGGDGTFAAAPQVIESINITDSVPPTGTITINSGAAYTNSTVVMLTLSCLGDNGCAAMQFSHDHATWSDAENYIADKSYTVPSGDGSKTIYVKFRNTLGSWSGEFSDTITLDTVAPSLAVTSPAADTIDRDGEVTIGGTVSDALTEVTVTISVDGLDFTPSIAGDGSFSQAISLLDEGLSPVTVSAEDEVGNVTTVTRNILFTRGTLSINQGAEVTSLTTVKLALDYYPSAAKMRFCFNNLSWTAWEVYAPTKSVVVPAGDGIKTIYVQFLDAQGEGSAIYFDSIRLDTLPPKGSLTLNAGATWTGSLDVTATLALAEAAAEVEMQFSSNQTLWSAWEPYAVSKDWSFTGIEGAKTLYARFRDSAGKISAIVSDAIQYKIASPVAGSGGALVINNDDLVTKAVAVRLSVTNPDLIYTQMQFSSDSVVWSAWEVCTPTRAFTLPPGDGVKTIWVRFRNATVTSGLYSDSILLDSKAPEGTIQINSGAPTTNDRNIVLTLTASDLNGVSGMQFSLDGLVWTAVEPLAASKALTLPAGEGVKTARVRFIDAAGVVSLVYSDTIIVDTLAASGKVVIAAGAAATKTATVTLTLTNLGSPLQMCFSNDGSSWSAWEPIATTRTGYVLESASDGIKTVSVKLRDAAGNISAPFSDTILYDTTRPTGTVLLKGSEATDTYSKVAAVKLQLTKNDLSTVQLHYRTYNGSLWSAWSAYVAYPATNTLALTLPAGNGYRGVEIQYKDTVGNESDLALPISDDILLDTLAPTGSLLVNGGATLSNSLDLTLTLAASDAGSGVEAMLVSANSLFTGATWETFAPAKAFSLVLPQVDGLKTVYVKYRDTAGNLSPVYSKAITLDRAAPTGTLSIAAGAVATKVASVNLTLTATGTPTQMRFSNDNSSWSDWQIYAVSRPGWLLTGGDGSKSVYLQLRDAVGNISSATISDSILFDTTPPTGTVLIKGSEASDTYSKSAAVKLQLSKDDLSPLQLHTRTYNGTLWSAWSAYVAYPASNTLAVTLPAGSGPRSVEVQYKDAVGNESVLASITDDIILDTVGPVLPLGTKVKLNDDAPTVDYSAAPGAGGLLPITLTVPTPTEAISGLATILWSANNLTWAEAPWVDGTFAISYPLAAPSVNISKTIYVKLKDRAGNLSVAYTDAILVTP